MKATIGMSLVMVAGAAFGQPAAQGWSAVQGGGAITLSDAGKPVLV